MTCPKCNTPMDWCDWDFDTDQFGRVVRKCPPQWACPECGECVVERGPNVEPAD